MEFLQILVFVWVLLLVLMQIWRIVGILLNLSEPDSSRKKQQDDVSYDYSRLETGIERPIVYDGELVSLEGFRENK